MKHKLSAILMAFMLTTPAAFAAPDMAFAQHYQAGRHGDFCLFDRNGCAGREPVAVFYANDPDGIVRKFPVLGDSALPESMNLCALCVLCGLIKTGG